MARIAVIGIGNVLTGDDAVGPYVVKVLEAGWELPQEVELLDAGTPGLDLTAYLAGLEAVVIVDAIKARGAPGELRVYDKEALLRKSPILAVSPHEPGVREAILNADFMGVVPPTVRLVGVIPQSVELGCALSPPVQAAVPQAVERVLAELGALGATARPRVPPLVPDLWWERKPA
ncbi:MAG TPA: hydrogenase maturation protease [Anaeromyxobacter sp.]|nr:hydrogenase maturation protease [Anaeromyxobacter sp.]